MLSILHGIWESRRIARFELGAIKFSDCSEPIADLGPERFGFQAMLQLEFTVEGSWNSANCYHH